MITAYYEISYFGCNFHRKSTFKYDQYKYLYLTLLPKPWKQVILHKYLCIYIYGFDWLPMNCELPWIMYTKLSSLDFDRSVQEHIIALLRTVNSTWYFPHHMVFYRCVFAVTWSNMVVLNLVYTTQWFVSTILLPVANIKSNMVHTVNTTKLTWYQNRVPSIHGTQFMVLKN